MQINFRLLPVLTLAALTTFTSCKKDSKPATTDSSTELTTHSDDQSRVSTQVDAVSNDVNIAIEASAAYTGRLQGALGTICDASVQFDSTSNPRKITITYDGTTSCNASYSRTGTVVVSMASGVKWKNQGAEITVTYQNVKVKRTSDNKSITLNGSHTITNVSGGLLWSLALHQVQSITHTVGGDLTITFDDNSQRAWHVATRRVFTHDGHFVLTVTGNNTIGNTEGVAEWGINRFGHAFTTSITQPLVVREDCAFRLTAGAVKHEGFGTATATFGLDANGNPTSCPGAGHYYMKLTWTGPNGASASATLPY
jgi:hypothetical protein